jgi:cell wall-associated NlpC family hydrolase
VSPARMPTNALRAVLALLAVALLAILPARRAAAAPDPADLESQIDQAWAQLEPTIEQYNGVHEELTANRARAANLRRRLRPLELQVDLALNSLGKVAAQVYRGGPVTSLNALLAGSSIALVDRLSILDYLARHLRAQISSVARLRDRYAEQKTALDGLIVTQARQDADLGARKKGIETQLAALQKLRLRAYGASGASGDLKPIACPVDYIGGAAGKAARAACAQIGKPYVWAAEGPGAFDCSGLTRYAWSTAGLPLRHYTKWQWQDSRPVSRSDLRPGDLVFYFGDLHHIGMYVGGGYVVHAPTTGDYVRMAKLDAIGPPAGFRRPDNA